MRIEIKNLKMHRDMSQETDCFSCSIYSEGKRVGLARNEGVGGPNSYDWFDREAGREIEAWAEAQELEFSFEKLDQIIDQLRYDLLERQELKRWCKNQTMFRLKGDEEGAWRTLKLNYMPQGRAWVLHKYSDQLEEIANERFEKAEVAV